MTSGVKKGSQNLIIWLCWSVYTIAYLGRYSYNANITLIIADYNITKAEAGLVGTFFFFAYGIGQVINGMVAKRYNKKVLFPLAMLVSATFNLMLFVGVPFEYIKYMWLLNGIVQSCFWPSIISVLSENLDENHMNKAVSLTGTSSVIGTVVIYGMSVLFVNAGNYELSFLISTILMVAIGLLWIVLYRPTGAYVKSEGKVETKTKKSSFKAIGLVMIVLAVFAIADNLIKDGLTTWVPEILKDKYSMADDMAILSTLVLPCLGIVGTLITVKLNEYVKDFVNLSMLLLGIAAIFLGVFAIGGNMNVVLVIASFGIVLCLMHAINTVITSLAPLKLRDKVDSGKMAGVMNGFCYLGSTISSYGLGAVADVCGWDAVFKLLFCVSFVVLLIGITYKLIKHKQSI